MTSTAIRSSPLGWTGIVRLGLVQMALGSMTVIAISTLNRIMVIEYSLPAFVPGVLIALHYLVQMMRPRLGHGSDVGGRRTPWIVGGLLLLGLGTVGAAAATTLFATQRAAGLLSATLAYVAIGLGVGAAGTSLLALLAKSVAPPRRAAAATILWIMMILGFALTAGLIGKFLDPYGPVRLVIVAGCAVSLAVSVAIAGIYGIESRNSLAAKARPATAGTTDFRQALGTVWSEPLTRRFTAFIFLSMLAFSALELLLEPFGGHVFHLTPGASARLAGSLHSGAVLGMITVALATSGLRIGSPRSWVRLGCLSAALVLVSIALCSAGALSLPLAPAVFALGLATGAFTVSSISVMMDLAAANGDGREGMRMGLFGGAQAVAFAAGGLLSTAAIDLARQWLGTPAVAYAVVFAAEGLLFAAAGWLAVGAPIARAATTDTPAPARDRQPRAGHPILPGWRREIG